MTTLRALVWAGSVLAFMGFVVFVPLGWALVSRLAPVVAAPIHWRSSRADQTSGKLNWCSRRLCHELRLNLWRRRSNPVYQEGCHV